MKYVIDASVGFKWLVAEPDSDKAIRLRDDYNNGLHELLAPDHFPIEIGNILAICERTGRIGKDEAAAFFADLLQYCPAPQQSGAAHASRHRHLPANQAVRLRLPLCRSGGTGNL